MNGILFGCFFLGGIAPPYCQLNFYCPTGVANVGCNPPPPTGGPACQGKAPLAIDINPARLEHILNRLNLVRSRAALGRTSPLPTAVRMPSLQWDEGLALQAGHNARSCVVANDACRNTRIYRSAGQNIGIVDLAQNTTIRQHMNLIINAWSAEASNITPAQIASFPSGYTGPSIANMAQLVNDRATKVGCAMQRFTVAGTVKYYFVCNFSNSNVANQPVYTTGQTAAGCTTGRNTGFQGLCSVNEVF